MITEKTFNEWFGDMIVRRCEDTGISHRELAEKAGLTEVSVSRYVHGTRTPSFYNAYKIMKALNIGVVDFRGADDEDS